MTVTLTREEAQQVLELITNAYVNSKLAETLRARLAQPEPEPHGYLWFTQYMEQRFTHRKPEERERIGDVKPLYTAPPQREWQGLTDEDIGLVSDDFLEGALWAENKLREKNG